jgi:nucleolar protein 56
VGRAVVTSWFGAFLVDGQEVLRAEPAPLDPDSLRARSRLRRAGTLTPEEARLLATRPASEEWTSRDRRLLAYGVRFDPHVPAEIDPAEYGAGTELARTLVLAEGEADLEAAWDPSVHVQEAVRAAADLERVKNLVGERLGSWVSRDHPDVSPGDHARASRVGLEPAGSNPLAPTDATLSGARQRLARLYQEVEETRANLSAAVVSSSPGQNANLAALLGPELAARMIAQAGGLDRLARLPSSTVQVLGAERAFFEHLRGRAPPPRHGLLFTHPYIQSAPRRERGRLARSLAGKVAIAARLDQAGSPVNPDLQRAFDARRAELKGRRNASGPSGRRSASRLPLDRAASDG